MADTGKRHLNYCPKCKLYFMSNICPNCKEYRPQRDYDERFRDLQGIPKEYRADRIDEAKQEAREEKTGKQQRNHTKNAAGLLKAIGILLIAALITGIFVFANYNGRMIG